MKRYSVEIRETSSKDVEVNAENREEAIEKVKKMHENEEVILTASDFTGAEFNIVTVVNENVEEDA